MNQYEIRRDETCITEADHDDKIIFIKTFDKIMDLKTFKHFSIFESFYCEGPAGRLQHFM